MHIARLLFSLMTESRAWCDHALMNNEKDEYL